MSMRTCKECHKLFEPRFINGIALTRCSPCLVSLEREKARRYREQQKARETAPSKPALKTALIKKLDSVFSQFIRKRDKGRCFTCGVIKPWKEMQCGHYVPRGNHSTRFDEINCNAQCENCNVYHEGQTKLYREALIKMHGKAAILALEARKYEIRQYTSQELRELIKAYKIKLMQFKYKV